MKRLLIEPDGWTCPLRECPPGFFIFEDRLCFKSEYLNDGDIEVFNEAGEYFWGGMSMKADRDSLIVQPVTYRWVDEE